MSISEPFIRRPVATTLLSIGLLLLGGVAYHFLPVAPLPKVEFPFVGVGVNQPGVDPATASASLAAPLEKRLGQIPGVTEMTASSSLGNANISIQFDLNRSVDDAARDVQAAINAAAGDLPTGLPNPPTYRKANPNDSPVMVLAMTSPSRPLSEVYNLADQLVAQRILQVSGVSQVSIGGGAKSAVRVSANPAALAAMGLSMEDLRAAIAAANVNLPKGSLDDGRETYVIAANDQLPKADLYQDLIVSRRADGRAVLLRDVATVTDSVENVRGAGWFNGQRAILLPVLKQAEANIIETVDAVRDLLPQLQRWLPPDTKLAILSDRTGTIRASVNDVQLTLVITMGLVVVVMFLFLRRMWPTVIAGVTMPLALAGTFGVMWLCDFSLNNLSLMALTISTGFVVDDAIVVIENIVRHIEKGETPFQAALKGAREIGFTVMSISLSLVAVFIPLLFMGGLIGRLFHEFAVTLSVAILVSGVVSLTLTPMMCAKLLRGGKDMHGRQDSWIYRTTEGAFNALLHGYERGLKWVLRHPRLMLGVTAVTVALTVWLYGVVPKGFFPQQDTGLLIGISEAAQDISFGAMSEKQLAVAKIIGDDPAVAAVGAFLGGGSVNNGRMFISLKEPKDRPGVTGFDVVNRLRPKVAHMVGVSVFINPVQDIRVGGRGGRGLYQYSLTSPSLDDVNTWAPRLVDKLKTYKQITDANTDQQFRGLQTDVVVDRDAAARLGVQPQAIDATLNSAFGQRQVSVIYTQQNQFRVVLEVDPSYRQDPTALDKVYVKAAGGALVPLSAVARFQETNTALSVNHQGQFPAVTVSFNLAPGVALGEASDLVDRAVRELGMPSSIRGAFQGTAQVFQASLSTQPILILTALIAVYIVLGMLYESLIHPLTILSTLPSAGLGALLALLVTGDELSVVGIIGIILLIGIVKKNAIMMVDFALEAERSRGATPEESIYEACVVRFRPIMMTTMAALFGALPLAIGMGAGSELRRPLGVTIVGGLIVSQMLTLYTTPVIYLYLDRARQRWHKRREKKAEATSAQPSPAPAKA